MSAERLLIIGIVTLLMGIQFRRVETFVLNERASEIVEERITSKFKQTSLTSYTSSMSDPYGSTWPADLGSVGMKSVKPPQWIGWSLVSVGAVLILTSPCYRK